MTQLDNTNSKLNESEQFLEDTVQVLIKRGYLGCVDLTNDMKDAIWWKMNRIKEKQTKLQQDFDFLFSCYNSFSVQSKLGDTK